MKTKLVEYIYGLTEDEIKILILQSTFLVVFIQSGIISFNRFRNA